MTFILLIPISFIGIFLTFYWFDGSFDQGGYTSSILLSGLVVNGLILIMNDHNPFRQSDTALSSLQAYLPAFQSKFNNYDQGSFHRLRNDSRLMHGRQEVFWYALALGTIGGLLFSVLVMLFLIPVFMIKWE